KQQIEEKEKESDSPKQKIKKKDYDKVKDQVKDKEKEKEKDKEQDKKNEKVKEKDIDKDKVKVKQKDKVKDKDKQDNEKDKKNDHKKNKRRNTLDQDPILDKLATRQPRSHSEIFQPVNLQESFFEFNSNDLSAVSEDIFKQITNSHTSAFQAFTVHKTQSYKDFQQPFTCIDQCLDRLDQLKIQFDQFKKEGFQIVTTPEQLNELKDMLVQSKKAKRTEDIKTLQLRVCSILNTLLVDNQDCVNVVIETGIIDEVLSIINLILLSQVQIVHLSPLHEFFEICSSQQKLLFINKGIIPTMQRLLDSRDELCVKIAVGIIERIIHASQQQQQSQGVQIDIRQIIENDGTLDKLVTVLQNDEYQDQEVNQNASLAIGQIFKASPLPKEFRNDVILTIKKMTNNEDQYISCVAIGILAGLAECQDNHSDILSSNYPASIARFISQKKDIIVHYTLQLIYNILTHGLQQTVGMAVLFFPIRTFEELSEHTDPFIAENARAIISIFKK
ncbi:MAG: hypothetical protein EZS28_010662, partial [Streblomastix strix]